MSNDPGIVIVDEHPYLEELKSLYKNINWENFEKRVEFLIRLVNLFSEWKGPLPNLRDIFQPVEIDRLLMDSVISTIKCPCNYEELYQFIEFVVRTGYKDEPLVGIDGTPLSRRTTAVHHAANDKSLSQFYTLFDELFKIYDRCDVNYTDEETGITHFHVACRCGCEDIVVKFLELGQDPNCLLPKVDISPLHMALMGNGTKKVIESLLRGGSDPNLADAKGWTPLHYICFRGDLIGIDLVEIFFKTCDDIHQTVQVDAVDNSDQTPLHLLFREYRVDEQLMRLLLRRGADPNFSISDGSTPLHIICKNSFRDFCELVDTFLKINKEINQLVHINAPDNKGNTPLHLALRLNRKKVAERLLRSGADPNVANVDGLSPYWLIIYQEKYDDDFENSFFKTSVKIWQTVQVDARNRLDQTPLQWAVANVNTNLVESLLDHGADLSGFVFPTIILKPMLFEYTFNLRVASSYLIIIENLERKGYEVDRSDAITIMKSFVECKLFEDLDQHQHHWYEDEAFVNKSKEIMMNSSLSLYDLIRLRPEEAEKFLTYTEYLDFVRSNEWWDLPRKYKKACAGHLCEKLARGLFRSWSLDSFLKLTKYRFPILCCEMIIDNLKNKDLLNVCLAKTFVESKIKSTAESKPTISTIYRRRLKKTVLKPPSWLVLKEEEAAAADEAASATESTNEVEPSV